MLYLQSAASEPPAFFQAATPPARLKTGESPISFAALAASAERPPEAQ